MASAAGFRGWYQVHKWSSLVCTLFLLLLCVTGLPLVFRDEIETWQAEAVAPSAAGADARHADLDMLVAAARGPNGLFPSETVRWISLEDDRSEIWIALAPTYDADRKLNHVVRFDARTGRVLEQRRSAAEARPDFIAVMFWLHKGLLAGEVGELFLGAMGILFLVATVSGVVLYAPFMRKLDFGTVRQHKGRRVRWLDLHNLLGISTVAWVLVVGVTGVLNEVSEPLYGRWRETAIRDLLKPYAGKPMPTELASVQGAADAVARALPGMKIRSVRYPDGELGSPHHYLVWAIGDSPLRSRLFQPALVDAATGELSSIGHVPWYLSAVQLARPLHFGDYGAMPMKVLWATLDLITIAVLGSGVYLWVGRHWRRRPRT
ncbi:PepSY domain-containing protein [Variovorax sp. Sphag1AA]|uniref:PepSY-associated TM helix domain-containing protein n=1 Tax=Variovorax sp. Sphag1AA TaxID=2587027 RepID=UPI001608CF10|nr:PepSY domain-containing protein [Variovorax sp. Sphag1AA]MBB3181867.1 putative iron-regulated membrane protein [Variovorax sp. Sphag1AA]